MIAEMCEGCWEPVVYADVALSGPPPESRWEADDPAVFEPIGWASMPFEQADPTDPLATWVIDADTGRARCLLPHQLVAHDGPVYVAHRARCPARRERRPA